MSAALKTLKWIVLGITGLFLALVLFLFFWIDPNDYKDEIATLVRDSTGMELAINGDIGWNFYPALGFSVEKLAVAPAAGQPELATLGKAAVSVEVLPLFSRQVNVRTLYLDGLAANLVVDAEGKGNWETGKKQKKGKGKKNKDKAQADGSATAAATPGAAAGAAAATADTADAVVADAAAATAADAGADPAADAVVADAAEAVEEASAPLPEIRIPKVVVTASTIDYRDEKGGSHYTVRLQEFVAENVTLTDEFPVRLLAALDDNAGMTVDLDLRAFVKPGITDDLHAVRALELTANAAGIMANPVKLTLAGDLAANLGDGTAKAGPLAFGVGNSLKGELTLDVAGLGGDMVFSGPLSVAAFNPKNLMRELGIEPPATTDATALTRVSLTAAIQGTKKEAFLEQLDIALDDSHVRGRAGMANFGTGLMAFDLALDAIDADRYLPPPAPKKGKAAQADKAAADAAPAAAPGGLLLAAAEAGDGDKPKKKKKDKPAAAGGEGLLPVDTLRTLNLDGRFTAGSITLMKMPLTALEVGVRANQGNVKVEPLQAKALDGSISGMARIDVREAVPHIVSHLNLDRVEVGGIVRHLAGSELLTGRTSLDLDINAHGNDIDTLLRETRGKLDLKLDNATLKGMNLSNTLTETLTKQLGSFSMLIPDYQQKLQKEIGQDTLITSLVGNMKLNNGVAHMPELKASLRDGSLVGKGQFDMVAASFDYTLAVRTDRLKDNKYFANAEFPVRCAGSVAGAPADWCRPDSKAIGDMLAQAAKGAAKDRFVGELSDKLGIDLGGASGAKKSAELQAKEKAKQKSERAGEEAKQKATKELDRTLQKYL